METIIIYVVSALPGLGLRVSLHTVPRVEDFPTLLKQSHGRNIEITSFELPKYLFNSNMVEATVLVLGTCDTKLQELLFLKDHIQQETVRAVLLDVGRDSVQHEGIDISQAKLIKDYGDGQTASDLPRGEVIKLMASCASRAVKDLFGKGKISGIISAGGSGGTSLAAQVMREVLPIGFPKVDSALLIPAFFLFCFKVGFRGFKTTWADSVHSQVMICSWLGSR